MKNDIPLTIGRIRLSEVMVEWSEQQPINPRLLASEVASALRSFSHEEQSLKQHISVTIFDPAKGSGVITYGALADYFESVSFGNIPETLEATIGQVHSGAVFLLRRWIDRVADEASHRAAVATGLSSSLESSPTAFFDGSAVPEHAPPPPLNGSSPEAIARRVADHRSQGELSAAEQLDDEKQARLQSDYTAEKERARADAIEAKLFALQKEVARLKQEKNEAVRGAAIAEVRAEQLAEHLQEIQPLINALNPDNPLSPPELRMTVQCWRELTRDGTSNPRSIGGKGVHSLVGEWLEKQGIQLNREKLNRLCAVVNWHKAPGAVRTN